ncbi:hypothetical protein B7P43_G17052 [Cryptotermes secundus]|uniref:Uncharacterized protein n=1 Tax=Cryptotermes secundus TaxID=105785 RepID=A0A2J7RT56_9NEOP|nr:hypothetical protein B7P43_G17052 [Cryptotermes secundus]
MPKEWTQGKDGCRKKSTATSMVTHRARVALQKKKETDGKMPCRAAVARCRRDVFRKKLTQDFVDPRRGKRPLPSRKVDQRLCERSSATNSQGKYSLECVQALIQDHSGVQPAVASGKIDALNYSPEWAGSRCPAQHPDKHEKQRLDHVEGSTPSKTKKRSNISTEMIVIHLDLLTR